MRIALILFLALGSSAIGAAWTQVPPAGQAVTAAPDQFGAAVESARRLLDSDVAAAIEALDRLAAESVQLRRLRALTEAERAVHRQLFLLRANGHLQLLNNDKVEDSFRELLRIDPLFSGQLAPREQEIVTSLRTREGGILEVTSPEAGATVLLNGVPLGITGDLATRTSVLAGEYEVRLEKEGYQGASARVTIPPGQTVQVRDLVPQRRIPPVAFLIDRDDFDIIVDNLPPVRVTRLSALRGQMNGAESSALDAAAAAANLDPQSVGAFLLRDPAVDRPIVVRFRRDCFVEEQRTIAVTTELLTRVANEPLLWLGDASVVRPQPDVGTLRVTSTPSDADVLVDGAVVGRTPFERNMCTGTHRVRVRHRIGSFNASASIARGRTEVIDAVIKPGVAFIGAVEAGPSPRYAADLATQVERALTSAVTSLRPSSRVDLPPEVARWTDSSAVELVGAVDRNDTATIARLLKLAADNFEAPLMVAAVRRPGSDAVELLVFWREHTAVDRYATPMANLPVMLAALDAPVDSSNLVYQNDLGLRASDVALPGVTLVVVRVDQGSPASAAGVKPGDTIEAVDGNAMTAQQLADRVRQKRPGEIVTLRIGGSAPRQVPLPLQRRPRAAPAFDSRYFGNALITKLIAAGLMAPSGAERDLYTFSVALVYMRFGAYKQALDLFGTLTGVTEGTGVGRGAVLYYRGRCLEALGDRAGAIAAYKEAAALDTQILVDDGTTVGTVARRRLAVLQ